MARRTRNAMTLLLFISGLAGCSGRALPSAPTTIGPTTAEQPPNLQL